MNTFGTLYRYECKKLFQKRIVWIALFLCTALIIISCFADLLGNVYIDGELVDDSYHYTMTDLAYARELDGKMIDQTLLSEMVEAYRRIPDDLKGSYIGTTEYQQFARPYSDIYGLVRKTTNLTGSQIMYEWQPDEEEFYRMRLTWLENHWDTVRLTQGEKQFWAKQNARRETPFVYREYSRYSKFFSIFQTAGILVLLLQAICLAGIFPEEHRCRTEQLNLCTVGGRKALYLAKLCAGISFAAAVSVFFVILPAAALIPLYGKGCPTADFQLCFPYYAAPLNCSQAVLIACGMCFAAAVTFAIFIMLLSEVTHSSLASLSIGAGLLFLSMIFSVPEQLRVLHQLWNWMPFCVLSTWNVFGTLTLPLLGQYFTAWQALPFIYLAAGAGMAMMGKAVYRRYQVAGR